MPIREIEIKNKTGIHARPATMLAKKAEEFSADIKYIYEGREVDGRNSMGIISLAVSAGNTIQIKAEGDDALEALDVLEKIIENRFGENR
jgi:phosphocarrier protein